MPNVKLFGGLRRHVKQHELDIPGTTINEVLQILCNQYSALGEAIFDENDLRPHIRVLVAGRDMELDDGLNTIVNHNDDIAIFPPIAGG